MRLPKPTGALLMKLQELVMSEARHPWKLLIKNRYLDLKSGEDFACLLSAAPMASRQQRRHHSV